MISQTGIPTDNVDRADRKSSVVHRKRQAVHGFIGLVAHFRLRNRLDILFR